VGAKCEKTEKVTLKVSVFITIPENVMETFKSTVCVLFLREMESKDRENSLREKSLYWSLVSANEERGPLIHFLRVIENLFIFSYVFDWLFLGK
jgi:hypothetical protein